MRFLPRFGCCIKSSNDCEAVEAVAAVDEVAKACVAPGEKLSECCNDTACAEESHLLKTVGWVSAALGAVALGLIIGRELRQRYKFNRRTPYDLYAHSGDELPDGDFSVGI
jgi:hypothetical protein